MPDVLAALANGRVMDTVSPFGLTPGRRCHFWSKFKKRGGQARLTIVILDVGSVRLGRALRIIYGLSIDSLLTIVTNVATLALASA
jgi:hypothetical protein